MGETSEPVAWPQRIGRYRIVERIGAGGMATVFRAVDEELGRSVALKLMHPMVAERATAADRFAREARAVAALRHPNVLQVYDYAPSDGARPAFLVAELVDGPTLQRFTVEHGAPLPEVAAMVGAKVARALGAAHAAGIVHRDVKPENVMVDGSGRVVLCDFGIAQLAASETLTATGAILGSPAYMSPEQAAGRDVDARSDQFSLGTLLYVLSTGALPFEAKEPLAMLGKIARGDHPPPSARNPRVPPYLERAVERCLQVDANARFPSAEAVAEALEAGLRADGFAEIDRELASYFRAPADWNGQAEERIVAASLVQANAALRVGETARAIALCGRVLAWRPEEAAATQILSTIERRGRVKSALRWATVALAGVAIGAGAIATRARQSETSTSMATSTMPSTSTSTMPSTNENASANAPAPVVTPVVRHRPPKTEISVAAPLAPVDAAIARPVEAVPQIGELLLLAQPYCLDGRVDGSISIDKGRKVELAPGRHSVRCAGPGGQMLERAVDVVAGETAEVRFDFSGQTRVHIALARGDSVRLDEGPLLRAGTVAAVAPGLAREVRLFRDGLQIARDRIDIPPGECTLRDEPLECRKP